MIWTLKVAEAYNLHVRVLRASIYGCLDGH